MVAVVQCIAAACVIVRAWYSNVACRQLKVLEIDALAELFAFRKRAWFQRVAICCTHDSRMQCKVRSSLYLYAYPNETKCLYACINTREVKYEIVRVICIRLATYIYCLHITFHPPPSNFG